MSQTGVKAPTRRLLWIVGAGAASATAGYVVYQYGLKDYVHKHWAALSNATSSAYRILDSLGAVSELSTSVAADLKAFLESDSDEIPRSVRQALKLSGSPEFQQAVLRSTRMITEGVRLGLAPSDGAVEGHTGSPSGRQAAEGKGLVEAIMQKLFSDEGKSFASAVCCRMVRTLVASSQSSGQLRASTSVASTSGSSLVPAGKSQLRGCAATDQQKPWLAVLVELLATERGKELVTVAVRSFAVHGVGTYLDKLGEGNMYIDLLSAVSRHQEAVKDVTAHVVTTTVKEVICSWRGGSRKGQHSMPTRDCASASCSSSSSSSSPRAAGIPMSAFSESDSEFQRVAREPAKSTAAEVAEFLAQPSIRRLILDLTAVTTSRGMEAVLLVLFSKVFGSTSLCSSSTSPPTLTLKEVSSCSNAPTSRDCRASGAIAVRPKADAAAAVCGLSPGASHLGGGLLAWGNSKAVASRALATVSVCLAVLLHHMTM